MNSGLIDEVEYQAKKQELEERISTLGQEKGDLLTEQTEVQQQMEERDRAGKDPDQSLVDRSKELPTEISNKDTEVFQTNSELKDLNREYAKSAGSQLDQHVTQVEEKSSADYVQPDSPTANPNNPYNTEVGEDLTKKSHTQEDALTPASNDGGINKGVEDEAREAAAPMQQEEQSAGHSELINEIELSADSKGEKINENTMGNDGVSGGMSTDDNELEH